MSFGQSLNIFSALTFFFFFKSRKSVGREGDFYSTSGLEILILTRYPPTYLNFLVHLLDSVLSESQEEQPLAYMKRKPNVRCNTS